MEDTSERAGRIVGLPVPVPIGAPPGAIVSAAVGAAHQDLRPGLGVHVLADFHHVAASLLCDAPALERLMCEAARSAGAGIVAARFHPFGEGQGVTGVVLLRESHISIHTWPEHGFAALDVFMCGSASADAALETIRVGLRPHHVDLSRVVRGPAR